MTTQAQPTHEAPSTKHQGPSTPKEPTMNTRRLARRLAALAIAAVMGVALAAQAATYYWDNNGNTNGFGTAGGTWSSAASLWNADSDGNPGPLGTTISSTGDALNFGNGATGLATGTVTVSGVVDSGDMTFASGSGTITLSGGLINLAPAATITLNNAADTVASVLGGAATSLTKTGTGTLTLGNTVNQFTGNTVISNGKVALGGQYSMWQSAYDTTGSTGAIGLDRSAQATPWLGGLAGSVDLATAITGYSGITTLTLNPQSGSSVSYGGVIANGSGAMALNKTGHGTQTLTGTNSYSGATTVWAGTLALADASGTAMNSAFTVRGGTLELDNSTNLVADRIANGTALSLGSLTLKGFNGGGVQGETVGATTFAVGGKVSVINGSTAGDRTDLTMGAVTRSTGAAIDFVGSGLGSLGGGADSPNVTSTGAFPSASNGILPWATVGGTQWAEDNGGSIRAYTGTFVDPTTAASDATKNAQLSGSGSIGSAKSFNSLNVIATGAGQSLNLNGNLTLTSGNGAILKSGAEAYTISATTGNITAGNQLIAHVDGGALTISAPLDTAILNIAKGGTGDLILSGTRAGTINGAIGIAGGQLEFQGNSTTLSGVITGAGGLTVNLNAGQTLTMGNNANSYAGPTIVKGGYLADSAHNSIGLPGGRTQTPNTNTSLIMSNLTLEGGVWYSRYVTNKDLGAGPGQVQVLAGTSGFVHDAAQGGASGFTLNGGREIVWGSTYFNPTVFVHSLSSGSNQTLNLGNGFDLNGSTRTVLVGDATYNAANGVSQLGGNIRNSSGTAGLTKTGTGTLLLSGTNTYNGATTISSGILRFSNQVSLYNNTPANWTAANIVVANGATLALNVGGSGQFTTGNVTTLLTNLGGANGTSTTGFAAGSSIGFDTTNAAGGTFTVADDIADSSGAGGGAMGVVKLGSNTLVLSGANNSYSGATLIRGGTLSLTGSLTGGTAITTSDNNNGGGGTALQGVLNQSAASVISGASSITQGSTGTSTLAGTNSYTGATTLTAGTLSVSASANLGGAAANLVFNGGTLQVTNTTNLPNFSTIGHTVVFNSGKTVGLNIASGTFTADQVLNQGTGGLTKSGAGTLILSGTNSYTGGTTLSGGTLLVSGSSALPSASQINWSTTGTTLHFQQDGATPSVTNTWSISGRDLTRTLVVDRATPGAANNWTLTKQMTTMDIGSVMNWQAGANITSGTPLVTLSAGIHSSDSSDGTIRLVPTGVDLRVSTFTNSRSRYWELSGTSTGNEVYGALADANTGSGYITGITKTGTGTWKLSGNNTYTRGTTINNGMLQFTKIQSMPATGAVNVNDGATLGINVGGSGEWTNGTTGTGTIGGLLAGTGGQGAAVNYSGNVKVGLDTTNAGGSLTYSGVIANVGTTLGLTKLGTGTLVLDQANTYTGTTTISGGTLEIGGGGTLGNVSAGVGNYAGNISNSGTLKFNSTADQTLSGVISDAGALVKDSSGILTLTNTNNYTGGTTISGGTLQIGNGGTSGSVAGNILNNAALVFDRSDTVTFNGQISGSGSLEQAGEGTLVLTGSNSYGATTISGGTLRVGTGGSLGSGNVLNNGILDFNSADSVSVGGQISGSGSMTQTGSGTTTLSGNSSGYAGTTTVSAGVLKIDASLGGTVTVDTAGTVTGTGQLANIIVGNGGTHAPGNSPGTHPVVGMETWLNGGTYEWEIKNTGGTAGDLEGWDLITADVLNIEALASGDPFNIDIIAFAGGTLTAPGPRATSTWMIFDYGTLELDGTFDENWFSLTLINPSGFGSSWSLVEWSIVDTGSSLQLQALNTIPEPSTMLLAGLGLAGLTLRRRRRTA